jgi:hypothetical protein
MPVQQPFFSEAFSKQKLYQSISSISGFLSFGHLDFFHFTEKKKETILSVKEPGSLKAG